jgi:hypothetical protein
MKCYKERITFYLWFHIQCAFYCKFNFSALWLRNKILVPFAPSYGEIYIQKSKKWVTVLVAHSVDGSDKASHLLKLENVKVHTASRMLRNYL